MEKIITEVLGEDQNILKETIGKLEKRLERKQSENENLLANIAKISEDEINRKKLLDAKIMSVNN